MPSKKIQLAQDVYSAALERLEWTFDSVERVCISFSGGKDSAALLHLAAIVATRKNKQFSVLFID